MKKNLAAATIIVLISILLLEIVLRFVSIEKKSGYEFLFAKPHRYLLPFTPDYKFSNTTQKNKYRVYDPQLGWSIGIMGLQEPLYFSDHYGIRCSKKDQTLNKVRPHQYDLIFLGDSFTHGDAVLYQESWPALIEERANKSVLSLGVGGYGIDQAAMRYINSNWRGDTVVLGLIAGDMDRSLNTIYNFYKGGMKTKPKYKFTSLSTLVINQPAAVNDLMIQEIENYQKSELFAEVPGFELLVFDRNLFTYSYIYRTYISTLHQMSNRYEPVYRTNDDRFIYCMRIIRNLANICRENEAKFVVLLLDNNNTFSDRKDISAPWRQLINKLIEMNINVWDITNEMFNAYQENPAYIIHPEEGVHYSVKGNSIVANLIIDKYL